MEVGGVNIRADCRSVGMFVAAIDVPAAMVTIVDSAISRSCFRAAQRQRVLCVVQPTESCDVEDETHGPNGGKKSVN